MSMNLKKLSKFLLTFPLVFGLNTSAFAEAELANIKFVSDNIIQINTNETLKKLPDSFVLNDTNPAKIIFDFIDVDFKPELKQKLTATTKNLQIVKDDNTNKTRLVITLKPNEKVNYKTELYRNGLQITLSPITEHDKNFDAAEKQNQNQTQSQNSNQNIPTTSPVVVVANTNTNANTNVNANNNLNNDKVVTTNLATTENLNEEQESSSDEATDKIKHFNNIIYSKTNNIINFNFLENNIEVNSHKDKKTDDLVIELLNTTLSKKAKALLVKNLGTYNKNNAFNMRFVEAKNNTLKFVIKHNKVKTKNKTNAKKFKNWDYYLSQTNKMLTLQLFENFYDDNENNNELSNAEDAKKNNQNLVEKNTKSTEILNTDKQFCEQMQTVSKSIGNILLTNLYANDINDFILANKCKDKNINLLTKNENNIVLIGNTDADLLDNLTKQYNTEIVDIPTISNDFMQESDINNVKTLNVSNTENIPLTLNFLVLQKNENNELIKMPKTTTKHAYKDITETFLNNTVLDFKNAKLSLEIQPEIISKTKTNLAITLRQNSSASSNNLNDTPIITKTSSYVDSNGTLSIAILSKDQQKILVLINPKINEKAKQ